jgi:hypothetical protein
LQPAGPDAPGHAPQVLRARQVSPGLPLDEPQANPAHYAPTEPLALLESAEEPDLLKVPPPEAQVPRQAALASEQLVSPQSTADESPASAAGWVLTPAGDAVPAEAPASLLPEGGPEPLLPRASLLSFRQLVAWLLPALAARPDVAAGAFLHTPPLRARAPGEYRAIRHSCRTSCLAWFPPADPLPETRGATAGPHLHQRNSSESSRLFPALSVCRE